MPLDAGTFSSAQLRERDKRIEEKHRQEIAALERKIENLRRSNDDTRKQLFDVVHRSERLAESLGYSNVFEAQEALDMMEAGFDFKRCLQRLQELENAMNEANDEKELYSEQMADIAKELDASKQQEQQKRESGAQLTQDFENLKQQHDALTLKFKRAADRYKLDYKRFNTLYQYLKAEDKKHRAMCNQEGITPAKKAHLEALHVQSKIAVMEQVEREIKGGDNGTVDFPEHLATPELRPSDMAYVTGSRTLVQQPGVDRLKRQHGMPSSSPTVFTMMNRTSSSRGQLDVAASSETEEESIHSPSQWPGKVPTFKLPGLPLSKLKLSTAASSSSAGAGSQTLSSLKGQHTMPSASPTAFTKADHEPDHLEVAASSETEEESIYSPQRPGKAQSLARLNLAAAAGSRTLNPLKRPLTPPTVTEQQDAAASSETEEESIYPGSSPPPFKLAGASKRNPAAAAGSSDTEEECLIKPQPQPEVIDLVSSDTEPESFQCSQPEIDAAKSSDTEPESLEITPVKALASSTTANVQRQVNTERPCKIRRINGIEFGETDMSTPRPNENLRPAKQVPQTDPGKTTRPGDYSVFKGKGRYGRKSDAGPSTSVNSRFVIDPGKNGGLDYQYDEVVRGKESRKRMEAGTCECCKDYYEAVGPLPSRLQPPLWRSPSTTPTKQCQHHWSAGRQMDIESHKKAISRHRHNWERAKTPPAYWNIGFPSTQEVGEINEKAERMHQEKVLEIEKEAASGVGKYTYRRK
ncbi:hypothetical protein EST38_g3440 [Candolleomyces aberdarensis]|uniref:DNA endonuclease activator Ctp1 C-terminal domain-containing protein n=1 Tax=Candolleomyces aberdarensis TaxID=2316362 RepID=A0A4Q2DQS5_9AGAR|nr:hypothetical protein EST38_g3440 [Candolleomyces aberdarensis]